MKQCDINLLRCRMRQTPGAGAASKVKAPGTHIVGRRRPHPPPAPTASLCGETEAPTREPTPELGEGHRSSYQKVGKAPRSTRSRSSEGYRWSPGSGCPQPTGPGPARIPSIRRSPGAPGWDLAKPLPQALPTPSAPKFRSSRSRLAAEPACGAPSHRRPAAPARRCPR
ncbi:uncharacterized protein RHO17_022383 [Thomomys bottae]